MRYQTALLPDEPRCLEGPRRGHKTKRVAGGPGTHQTEPEKRRICVGRRKLIRFDTPTDTPKLMRLGFPLLKLGRHHSIRRPDSRGLT